MRDPERIDRICRKLYFIWGDYPDMRFGQFLENYIFGHHISHPDGCIFHIEDDIVEKKLDEMIKEKQKRMFRKLQDIRKDTYKKSQHFDDSLDIVGDDYR